MNSPTEENYLKALYKLSFSENKNNKVSLSELSKLLSVSTPTANSMIKRLNEKKLVVYQKYKPIELTKKGQKVAALIIRKHRLTEMFLVEKMGFGWEEVHAIAEQVEHIKSPAFFDRMDKLLGFPDIDPHGSPIPNKDGVILTYTQSDQKLSEAKAGEQVRIVAVNESSLEFLKFLNSREIGLGTELQIIELEPYDGTMKVSYGKRKNEFLSSLVCEKLYIERI